MKRTGNSRKKWRIFHFFSPTINVFFFSSSLCLFVCLLGGRFSMNLKVSIQIDNKTATEFHTNSNQNNNKKDENSNPNTFFSYGIQFNSIRIDIWNIWKKRVCFQLSSNMCVCFLFRNLSFSFLSFFSVHFQCVVFLSIIKLRFFFEFRKHQR